MFRVLGTLSVDRVLSVVGFFCANACPLVQRFTSQKLLYFDNLEYENSVTFVRTL